MAYAEGTRVPINQTKGEIEKLVRKVGATKFGVLEEEDRATILFTLTDRHIRFVLPLNPNYTDQVRRSRWRALMLVIKAKLESAVASIETVEEAFLAQVVMPGGRTVYEESREIIRDRYLTGDEIPLLPPPRGGDYG